MQNNFITNLLDLKGVKVTKFRNRKNRIRIHIELPVKEHICPCCHSKTSKIHDYKTQTIKDVPIYFKPTNLIYNNNHLVGMYPIKVTLIGGAIGFVVISIVAVVIRNRINQNTIIYDLEILHKGKQLKIKTLIDSRKFTQRPN